MSIYDERPWLALYAPGVPHDIEPEHDSMLVAFEHAVSADPDKTTELLIAFCRERMAPYKYPRQIEFVDELPKTASGKILRRELRQKEVSRPT